MKDESKETSCSWEEEEEEKKESSPLRETRSKLEDLQKDIPEELQGIVYTDERKLWEAQNSIGLSDLEIVLNSEGYAVWREMPDPPHEAAVCVIRKKFFRWENEQGAELDGDKDPNVYLSQSFERNMRRRPDFAIWGPDRLTERGNPRGDANLGKFMNPHVIFQFSWGSKLRNEKLAMDDMSLYAGQDDLAPLGRPNVLYLIKALRRQDVVSGFDVYVVRQGERTANEPALTYRLGGNEDLMIEVLPQDMGLLHGANSLLIPLSDIRVGMEGVGVVFEAENQDV